MTVKTFMKYIYIIYIGWLNDLKICLLLGFYIEIRLTRHSGDEKVRRLLQFILLLGLKIFLIRDWKQCLMGCHVLEQELVGAGYVNIKFLVLYFFWTCLNRIYILNFVVEFKVRGEFSSNNMYI